MNVKVGLFFLLNISDTMFNIMASKISYKRYRRNNDNRYSSREKS